MKNIEINIKEQDTYEALLPASISNVVYSSDTVNSMFNLSTGSMIDDAFSAINTNFNPLMANLGIVTVKLWDGTPVEGITLDGGIKDNNGNTPITDSNGRAVVSTNTNEFTFSIASLWADISDVPSQSYPKTGAPTYISVTMADKGIRKLEVTSSQTIRFSSVVKQFDVFGVGGGGGGAFFVNDARPNDDSNSLGYVAGGGAGGYTKTLLSQKYNQEEIQVVLGAGGVGGSLNSSSYHGRSVSVNGGIGGTTSVSLNSVGILSVNGGGGGKYDYTANGSLQSQIAVGGSSGGSASATYSNRRYSASLTVGGEDGGNDEQGQGTTTRAFGEDEGDLYASGGGAAYVLFNGISDRSNFSASNGGEGAGNGIAGKRWSDMPMNATSPTTPGSGGGACARDEAEGQEINVSSSAGASGIVIFRWTV